MEKQKSFKVYFSDLLEDRYSFSEEEIKEYWDNKKEQEAYHNKKMTALSVGIGEIVGTTAFAVWDMNNGADCIIPIAIAGGIGVLTAGVALVKSNPYNQKEYKEIDADYKHELKKFKRRNK